MQGEASGFESSEMLATFIASTPLIEESWKLCSCANSMAPQSFLVNRIGDVAYVAFSGVQLIAGLDRNWRDMVPLTTAGAGVDCVFSALNHHVNDGDEPPMVLSCFLNLFLSLYNSPNFQTQMSEILANNKSIVFTGHSIGGSIASLSALCCLSHFHSISSSFPVMCISYGSPMLGNESFSKAVLQERWGGNFLHVVSKHDIVPRLLFTPLSAPPILPHMLALFNLVHLVMKQSFHIPFSEVFPEDKRAELLKIVQHSVLGFSESEVSQVNSAWPFGSYILCSNKGSVCMDNPVAVAKLLHLMLEDASSNSCVEDHLNYENYVAKISWQILTRGDLQEGSLFGSNYETGLALALDASDITQSEKLIGGARHCLMMAKQSGRTRNLKCANLAIDLAKINPLRAQIEWYKTTCDASDDELGYYDTFKLRGASKRHFKVNMNRIKLARFWDHVVEMVATNQLPYNFHNRLKWINASQFYKLLVEPLDIAEYYKQRKHLEKGHYMEHGREKRYMVFDKWWKNVKIKEEDGSNTRRQFASLTQDSCFWARLEEARDGLSLIRSERDPWKVSSIKENINAFDQYARRMIQRKEVSKDVLAKNSSYNQFVEEWRDLKSQLDKLQSYFPDGEGNNSCRDYILGK